MMFVQNKQGVSMMQLIITMSILLVLAAATFIWIDPLARIGEAKNKRRTQDVNFLAAAIFDYAGDHNGALPVLGSVTTNKKVLCSSQGGADLSCDGTNELCLTIDDDDFYKYLGALPFDPDKNSAADTGYYLQKDGNNNLVVGSCDSYDSAVIIKQLGLKVSCSVYGGGYCWYKGASANINCDTVCSALSLDCVKNVMYGPDKDSGGTAFCRLNQDFDVTCSTCILTSTSTPPWYSGTDCTIQIGAVTCGQASGATNYPICVCN